jgi:hypothetical protein
MLAIFDIFNPRSSIFSFEIRTLISYSQSSPHVAKILAQAHQKSMDAIHDFHSRFACI